MGLLYDLFGFTAGSIPVRAVVTSDRMGFPPILVILIVPIQS
jgi:hypothetical protein